MPFLTFPPKAWLLSLNSGDNPTFSLGSPPPWLLPLSLSLLPSSPLLQEGSSSPPTNTHTYLPSDFWGAGNTGEIQIAASQSERMITVSPPLPRHDPRGLRQGVPKEYSARKGGGPTLSFSHLPGMGGFNSDDYHIYYCGQESHL